MYDRRFRHSLNLRDDFLAVADVIDFSACARPNVFQPPAINARISAAIVVVSAVNEFNGVAATQKRRDLFVTP
jgi:hypothetical protein